MLTCCNRTAFRPLALSLLLVAVAGLLQPAAARNLLANSSFEIGPDHRYAVGRWYMQGLPNTSLDATTKVHGKVSLRVPFSRKGYNRLNLFGIEFRSGVSVPVKKGKTYTFSIYLKTDVPDPSASIHVHARPPYEHRGGPIAWKEIKPGRRYTPQGFKYPWKRFSITFTAKKDQDVFWSVGIEDGHRGNLWVDAAQFEEGELSDYQPLNAMEVGLMDRVMGHIHEPGKTPAFDLVVSNVSDKPQRRRVLIRVLKETGKAVSEKTLDLKAAPGERRTEKIELDAGNRNGFFVAALTMPEVSDGYLQDTVFSILPEPRKVTPVRSAFGAYATPSEEGLRILARAGFHWTATLTSAEVLANWGMVESTKGRYAWHDDEIDLFRKYGFEIMMNLEGWVYPKWAKSLSRKEKTEAFARYVEATTRHYRGKVRYFNLADEIHNKVPGSHMLGSREAMWKNAKEYAAWHKVGYAAAKRGNPDSQVVLNTEPGAFGPDHLFRYLSPNEVDILAANYYPYPKQIKYLKQSADSAGISTLWAPGVAINTWPTYFRYKRPMNDGWAWQLENIVKKLVQTFANGAQVFFHYTASYVGNTNVYSIFEHDSSLETGGAQFAALAWLVDGFKTARAVPMVRNTKLATYRFDRRDGKTVFVLWSTLDGENQKLEFKDPIAGARVYDRWTNELPVAGKAGLEELALSDGVRFLILPSATADAAEHTLSTARYRIAALPKSETVERAGPYALLTRGVGKNKKKNKEFQLWFEDKERGWVEVLRRHVDPNGPAVKLDENGLAMNFSQPWDGKAGHMQIGGLPRDQFWGARFWRSMPGKKGMDWQMGSIVDEKLSGRVLGADKATSVPRMKLAPTAYAIESPKGFTLAVETDGEQPNPRFSLPGAWDIYVWRGEGSNRSIALWRYVHGAKPRTRDMRVRVRVVPGPVKLR
jgi:hypothetical protein